MLWVCCTEKDAYIGHRRQMRSELGISDDEVALINLGRLASEKNIDELLEFYKQAKEENSLLKFIIVGGGPAKEALEERARELEIDDSVVFVGMVPPTEVGKYYKLGDIFVSASTSETQGLTYIEAMANGLPLVCRYDTCLDDVLIDGENGYIYRTKEEFLSAIQKLAENPVQRVEFGSNGKNKASEYDKAIFAERVEAVYKSAIAQKAEKEKTKAGKA